MSSGDDALSPDELSRILTRHAEWIESNRKSGERAHLHRARLDGIDLSNANLSYANLRDASLRNADLRGANLNNAVLFQAWLSSTSLRGAKLAGANLHRASLRHVDLSHADLSGARLREQDLASTNLDGANLEGANLRGAKLEAANLRGAKLKGAILIGANLHRADLSGADLTCADLSRADLSHATLDSAKLQDTKFNDANLIGADCSGANLSGSNLSGVVLANENGRAATFARANLREATFTLPGDEGAGGFLELAACGGLDSAEFGDHFLLNYLGEAFEYAHRRQLPEAIRYPEFVQTAIARIRALRMLYGDAEDPPQQLVKVVQLITDELIAFLQHHPNELYNVRPRQFEELIAEVLASYGWDVHLTPSSKDGGYDIFAISKDIAGVRSSWVIECKKYARERKVGVDIARALYGTDAVHDGANALLATTSFFTQGVMEYKASRYNLELRDYHGVLEWINEYRPNPDGRLYVKDAQLVSTRGDR